MERHYFESSHGRMSYLSREGKLPVLFIHGFTASAYIWRSLPKYLDSRFALIFVDLFGHGKSDAPSGDMASRDAKSMIKMQASAISELMESISIEQYSLVGSSLGGWISLELAVNFRRPSKAVLIDSAGIMTLEDGKYASGLADLMSQYSRARGKTGRMLSAVIRNSSPDSMVMDRSLIEKSDFPVSVIWGSDDHILDPSYGVKLSGMLKNSEFHVIDGADHTPFRTHARQVADLINEFLLRG